ncbi:DUF6202 family protein [Streptomyces sp. NPDC017520]|uniref:DUF6202 family protein n=1 Tax=Streptomyces sp. NPDC017520 TaxID=3364998 RepID=UPI00379F716A
MFDDSVSKTIAAANLTRPNNKFFARARSTENVAPVQALRVALQWEAMTRTFMFTTIASLGVMAQRFSAGAEPSRDVLGAYQTAYRVIGDDMANFAGEFGAVAPKGVAGVHYVWWAESIVGPLTDVVEPSEAKLAARPAAGVGALIANMRRLAAEPLGAAVQLRVVEAIALDIAVAFRRMYAKVAVAGASLYKGPDALDWINSHIKAETSHASSVSDEETGMTAMVSTVEEQRDFARFASEYTANWARALDDFATALAN